MESCAERRGKWVEMARLGSFLGMQISVRLELVVAIQIIYTSKSTRRINFQTVRSIPICRAPVLHWQILHEQVSNVKRRSE
jgi:hypothetical protein